MAFTTKQLSKLFLSANKVPDVKDLNQQANKKFVKTPTVRKVGSGKEKFINIKKLIGKV